MPHSRNSVFAPNGKILGKLATIKDKVLALNYLESKTKAKENMMLYRCHYFIEKGSLFATM